jgi:CDP-diacylglycerol---glycerol-3-phosphate 3-phosphatidyltransferase
MLSARPYLHPPIASEAYAQERLRGTVWERVVLAHLLYRGLMAFGRALGRAGVSADALTYGSLVGAGAAAIAAASGEVGWAAVLVLASGALDVLDGVVARATGTVSRFGALLDSTVDRLADGLPLLGVMIFYGKDTLLAVIPAVALLGGFSVSYVRARAEALGAVLPPLFMRRAERVLLVAVSLLLGLVSVPAAGSRAPLMLAGLAILAALNLVAVVAALRSARLALGARSSLPNGASTSE